jgi:hypothetical protein
MFGWEEQEIRRFRKQGGGIPLRLGTSIASLTLAALGSVRSERIVPLLDVTVQLAPYAGEDDGNVRAMQLVHCRYHSAQG